MQGDESGITLRLVTMNELEGPFWYMCNWCGYHPLERDTVELAAHAWNTASRAKSFRRGNNPVVDDALGQ
jgi:hypothetical protein